MASISQSFRHNLDRLSLDERSEDGGLLGKMHTHADFDAPLAEEFLIL